jgi:hypothetical protein
VGLGRADAGSTTYVGIGSPLVIGLGFLALGAVLMGIWRVAGHREFFGRRPEAAEREPEAVLEPAPPQIAVVEEPEPALATA